MNGRHDAERNQARTPPRGTGVTPCLPAFPYNSAVAMRTARHYRIYGRVQGVGFRFFTEEVAMREGLSGFVRNVAGGSVEAQVEGDLESVERFENALYQGPPGARVERVEVTELAPEGRHRGFMVRG
jgi:acylphosphatase